jgi:hypothetical protein
MISEGTMLAADWIADWVDEWNLGRGSVCALRHAKAKARKPEVLVDTHNWFGMIGGGFSIWLQKMYDRWIHTYRYGRN